MPRNYTKENPPRPWADKPEEERERLLKAYQKHAPVCCDKAVPFDCVCMYSFWCPDHGEHHFGTHD